MGYDDNSPEINSNFNNENYDNFDISPKKIVENEEGGEDEVKKKKNFYYKKLLNKYINL